MNSRPTKWAPVFKTGGLNRSPTPPNDEVVYLRQALNAFYQLIGHIASPPHCRKNRSKSLSCECQPTRIWAHGDDGEDCQAISGYSLWPTVNLSARRYCRGYVPFLNMRAADQRLIAHSQACKKYGPREWHRSRYLPLPFRPSQKWDQTRTIVH